MISAVFEPKRRFRLTGQALSLYLLCLCLFTSLGAHAQLTSLVPTKLDFTANGAPPEAKTVVLRNLDPQSPLTITSIEASGGFSEAHDCAFLQPGESCRIWVSFRPLSAGHIYGSITIHDNAQGSPHVISLSGTLDAAELAAGLAANLIPSADEVTFPPQPAGSAGIPLRITLTNRSDKTLPLRKISVSGGFRLLSGSANDCASTLPSHQSCGLRVTFAPQQAGWQAGAATVDTDAGQRVISLSGTSTPVARFAYGVSAYAFSPVNGPSLASFTVNPSLGQLRQTEYLIPPSFTYLPYADPLGRFIYTQEDLSNVHTWGVNPQSGVLSSLEDIGVAFQTGNIAVHPSGQFIYVNDIYTDNGSVTVFTVSSTGQLTSGNSFGLGISAGNISVDPTGRFLYAGGFDNYSGNPNVNIFSIDPQTGDFTPIQGSPFTNRYATPSSFDPSGRFAFAPAPVRGCKLVVYSIDQTSGALTPVPGSPFTSGGCGGLPSPSGQFFYFGNGGLLFAWSVDQTTGTLTPLAGSPFRMKPYDGLSAIDPSGHFIYFVNSFYNRFDTYALDPLTGLPGSLHASVPGNGFPWAGPTFVTGPASVIYNPTFTYISNQASNNVSGYSVNSKTGSLTQVAGSPFPVGNSPASVALRALSPFVYIANNKSNTVSAFSTTASGALVQVAGSPYATGNSPAAALVDPSGQFLYLSNFADNTVSGFLINPTNGTLTAMTASPFKVSGTGPTSLATDPSGTVLFVGNQTSMSVSAYYISLTDGSLVELYSGSPFLVGFSPDAFAFDTQNLNFYACDPLASTIHTFAVNYYTYNPPPAFLQEIGSPQAVGSDPVGIAVDPTGRYLYVANHGSNNVSGFHIEGGGILTQLSGSPFPAGSAPSSIAIDVSGKFVLVTNSGSNKVSVFRIGSKGGLTAVSGSPFATGSSPSGVAAEGSLH